MDFDSDLMIIRGEILASMKNKSYMVSKMYMVSICFVVSIELEKNGNISSAACSCLRGIKCYHIATLALFGHYNILVTDKECSQNAPPKPKSRPVKSAEELYPPKPYTALENGVPEESIKKLKEKLGSFGNTVNTIWMVSKQFNEVELKKNAIDHLKHYNLNVRPTGV